MGLNNPSEKTRPSSIHLPITSDKVSGSHFQESGKPASLVNDEMISNDLHISDQTNFQSFGRVKPISNRRPSNSIFSRVILFWSAWWIEQIDCWPLIGRRGLFYRPLSFIVQWWSNLFHHTSFFRPFAFVNGQLMCVRESYNRRVRD